MLTDMFEQCKQDDKELKIFVYPPTLKWKICQSNQNKRKTIQTPWLSWLEHYCAKNWQAKVYCLNI
jgi:hypothetical protein